LPGSIAKTTKPRVSYKSRLEFMYLSAL
jgi:hypothetical protein